MNSASLFNFPKSPLTRPNSQLTSKSERVVGDIVFRPFVCDARPLLRAEENHITLQRQVLSP